MSYQRWILDYKARTPQLLGRCIEAAAEMREAFPELREIRGHVWCQWGKRGHVWLQAPDGAVVDPTREQFPGPIDYEPWKPGDEVRTGKCMWCGDDIWRAVDTLDEDHSGECACSPECERELQREFAP